MCTYCQESLVTSTFTQLYNEDIVDLFAEQSKKLRIHEDQLSNIYVAGATEQKVNSEQEVSVRARVMKG